MAKQSVNLGSSANDGTGDPLRTAFDKINDNFDELYLYSTAATGNNITITGNTIASDNTNGIITIDPNGTGTISLSATTAVTGALSATGNITTTGTVEPAGDTAAGDNAAIGYTAALGLILTGQGTTNDVTIVNDADATVLSVPTGTLNVTTAGRLAPTTFSTGVSVLAATVSITAELHAGKTLSMADVGGNTLCTYTLPAATGTGDVYRFYVGIVNTSNYVIKVANATDTIKGQVIVQNDTTEGGTASVIGWKADGTDDTITLNGGTTGGASIGDYIEIMDIAANQFTVHGMLQASGSEATPFSATVS